MSDQEMEAQAPAAKDPSVGLATAMIVLTTVMLLAAFLIVEKILGAHYGVGPFK